MLTEQAVAPRLISGKCPSIEIYDADIIILTLNRCIDTIEAVQSAANQKLIRTHITVLDQGSNFEAIEAFTTAFDSYENIAFFASDRNLGVAGGRNFLSSIGHGQIIVALDNDAVFADDYVVWRSLMSFYLDNRLGALGFNILDRAGSALDSYSWGYPAALRRRYREKFETTTFVGAGYAVRRSAWEEAEAYDNTLFFTWEEFDFSLRAISRGWKIRYDGSLTIRHKVSSDARIGWSADRARFYVRNRIFIGRKWGQSWMSLTPLIVGYLLKGAINLRLFPTIIGIAEAVRFRHHKTKLIWTNALSEYVWQNDGRHRGSLYQRIGRELLKKVPVDL